MPLRRILLRVMLWSLGIGAVLGALAILAGAGTAVWRVSGTTFSAAVAAGLMMIASRVSEQKSGRLAGLVGMLLIVVEFLLALILIWDVFPGHNDDSLAFTAFLLFLCGAPAVQFLRLYHTPNARIMSIAAIAFAVVAFLISMIGCWWVTGWSSGRDNWFASAATVGCMGLLIAVCLIGVGCGGPFPALIVRMGGALVGFFTLSVGLVGIWKDEHQDSAIFRIPLSVAAVIAHANLCFAVPLKAGQRWVRWATIAATACTAVFTNFVFSFENSGDQEFTGRLAGAAGVMAACGSLALLVLARMNRKITDDAPVLTEIRELTIICPGCQKKQSLPVGEASCPTCRLRFHLRVEEPHCPQCDYLLYKLTSDRCPECGTAV